MKPINTFLTIVFISLLSSPSWSETYDELVYRDGLYYKQFNEDPFTGKITGNDQGSLKNGRKEGTWVRYWSNGQVRNKGNYKNGEREGAWVSYITNGKLFYKGNFKNGKAEGTWVYYHLDGTVFKPWGGTFKNGVKISD